MCWQSRPFGVALLVAGWDEDGPVLYHTDPSGTFYRCGLLNDNLLHALWLEAWIPSYTACHAHQIWLEHVSIPLLLQMQRSEAQTSGALTRLTSSASGHTL